MLKVVGSMQSLKDIEEILEKHTNWRGGCLNMIASENITSESLRRAYTCELSHRYPTYHDDPAERNYTGTRYLAELEIKTLALAKEVFNAEYVDFRPLGGTMAALGVLNGLTKAGEVIYEVGDGYGGQKVADKFGRGSLIKDILVIKDLPYDRDTHNIDVERLREMILEDRPRLIMFGGSNCLFPEPIREVREVADDVGSYITYDASHLLGLIAGKAFPNPLDEGADVVHGSTHKTFGGPQGGMYFTRDKAIYEKVRRGLYPPLVTNHHAHRIPCYAVQLLEFKQFGEAYAGQIVKNSQALGRALDDAGIPALCPERNYSRTHVVRIDVTAFGGGKRNEKKLEEANIVTGGTVLPKDIGTDKQSGMRLGTQEITRIGMKERDMASVAGLIKRVVADDEDPQRVAEDVREFVARFDEIQYTFDEGTPPYKAMLS